MAFVVKSDTLNRAKVGHEEEWCEFEPGVSFLIRGMGHRFVQVGIQANREAQQQVYARFRAGDVSALAQGKTEFELNVSVLGGLVLADWKGVTLESGDELTFTPDTATAVVSDPDNQPLVEWLIAEASRISRDAKEKLDGRVGKSSSATGGKRSGATKPKSSEKSQESSE